MAADRDALARRFGPQGAAARLKDHIYTVYDRSPGLQRLAGFVIGLVARPLLARNVRRAKARQQPLKLVIGANFHAQPGWIGTEIYTLNLLDADDWARYFDENSLDAIMAEHVWEHLTPDAGLAAARMCFRYLRPGGHLRVAVPDGNHPDAGYVEWVKPGGPGPGAHDHKRLYIYGDLRELFRQAGFSVELLEYWDDNGVFHEAAWSPDDGLIRRSRRFDRRNRDGPHYTSLIADAWKPADTSKEP